MTLAEFSAFLDISQRTARKLILGGLVPHRRVGSQIRILTEDVIRYLQEGGARL